MNSKIYIPPNPERLEKLHAIWKDFSGRLERIIDGNQSRYISEDTRVRITLLKNLTLEAMQEVRRK